MASYRDRVTKDLEGWIASGLVPEGSRAAILDSVADRQRPDTANALGYVGVALLGLAVIAFVAANWSGIPRIGRFALIGALFLAAAGGAAFATARGRLLTANLLLLFATLVFAADIGLTGQIFDLAGDPQTALYGAAAGGLLLALAGRSSAAATAALLLVLLGDKEASLWREPYGLALSAFLAAGLAFLWRSPVLAHGAGVALVLGTGEVLFRLHQAFPGAPDWALALAAGAAFAVAAVASRRRGGAVAGILHGWLCIGALVCLMVAGAEAQGPLKLLHRAATFAAALGVLAIGRREHDKVMQVIGWLAFAVSLIITGADTALEANGWAWKALHRLVWLGGAIGLIVQARHDRSRWITALGVLALAAAVSATLSDFGLDLAAAAGVFALVAAGALAAAYLLRRRSAP